MAVDVLPWFAFRDRRRRVWRVFLAHPSWFEPHERERRGTKRYENGFAGLTLPTMRAIYLNAAEERSVQDETLLHEMMHAVLTGFVEAAEPHEAISDETEERAICAISPRLYPVVRRMGLSWPRRPRGAAALERRSAR